MNLKTVLILIHALVAIQFCTAQNNTGTEGQTETTSTNDDKEEKSALQKGMEPIFDLCHNFLDTVMSKNFYDADTPFNIEVLIKVVNQSDYGKLQKDWQDLVQTFGGYAGCIIVGMIFVVFMPIIGCIYCCCHCCCHQCGGTKETMDPRHATCKRWTYTVLLLIFATFMLAGCIITFLGSELFYKSVKNEGQNGLVGEMSNSLTHLQTFANSTINDIKNIAQEEIIDKGLNKILHTVKDAANRTVTKVKDRINATYLLEEAADLGQVATTALEDLKKVKARVNSLRELQTNISTTLDGVKSRVENACPSGTNGCQSLVDDVKSLIFSPNYTSLNTLDDKVDQVSKAVNISNFVKEAEEQFNNVSKEVNSSIESEISGADSKINDLTSDITKEINGLAELADPFIKSMEESRQEFNDANDVMDDIADYIWYACIGMGCAVLLVIFFYYLGVLYGLCGERPGPRAACCNRGTGANLLCTGICCTFLFCWILMIVVILLFALGGLSYSMACKYVAPGVENVKVFESVLSDGFNWNVGKSFDVENLTIAGMFEDCKENTGIYSALKLHSRFDIDKQLNLSDVKEEVNKIVKDIPNIGDIELMSPELKNELENFKDADLKDINFTQFTTELNKKLFGNGKLDEVIMNLTDSAQRLSPTSPPTAATLRKAAADLQSLKDNQIAQVNEDKGELSVALSSLQKQAQESVPDKIDQLIADINKSQNTFNSERQNITRTELGGAASDILGIIEDTVNSTKYYIKYDFGRCRPLYNAAQSIVDAVCVITLDPFNTIWFGLGWSLFFFIPCFIFAALLANLYKRSEKYKNKDTGFDDPIHSQYTGDHNGYHGNRYEDNVPLTSMGKDQRYSANGAYNQGYQGRDYEHEPRYHRDDHRGYPPDNYSRDHRASRGSGHHYAQPHVDPYDQPPRYDDAVLDRYDRGPRHGPVGGSKIQY